MSAGGCVGSDCWLMSTSKKTEAGPKESAKVTALRAAPSTCANPAVTHAYGSFQADPTKFPQRLTELKNHLVAFGSDL